MVTDLKTEPMISVYIYWTLAGTNMVKDCGKTGMPSQMFKDIKNSGSGIARPRLANGIALTQPLVSVDLERVRSLALSLILAWAKSLPNCRSFSLACRVDCEGLASGRLPREDVNKARDAFFPWKSRAESGGQDRRWMAIGLEFWQLA